MSQGYSCDEVILEQSLLVKGVSYIRWFVDEGRQQFDQQILLPQQRGYGFLNVPHTNILSEYRHDEREAISNCSAEGTFLKGPMEYQK